MRMIEIIEIMLINSIINLKMHNENNWNNWKYYIKYEYNIGMYGCAITALGMYCNKTPLQINTLLIPNTRLNMNNIHVI